MKPATGAHTGTGSWLMQRATAVAMAVAVPIFVWRLASIAPLDYGVWKALFAPLWMRLLTLMFTAALALHAWVGMRDILMDYVRHTGFRLALYLIVIGVLASSVLTMAMALWGVA